MTNMYSKKNPTNTQDKIVLPRPVYFLHSYNVRYFPINYLNYMNAL